MKRGVPWFTIVGVLVFTIGLIVAVVAIFDTYSENEKPTVSMVFDPEKGVEANVKVQGLSSDEEIGVKVSGLRPSAAFETRYERFTLYDATIGPNAEGEVDHTIKLLTASGIYDLVEIKAATNDSYEPCLLEEKAQVTSIAGVEVSAPRTGNPKTGCLIFTLPRLAQVPELDARLHEDGDALTVTVMAENAPSGHCCRSLAEARVGRALCFGSCSCQTTRGSSISNARSRSPPEPHRSAPSRAGSEPTKKGCLLLAVLSGLTTRRCGR